MNKTPVGNVKEVLDLLPHGSEHPITAKTISSMLNINLRDIYSIINSLIMHYDIPVGGLRADNRHGYFIITNEQERHNAIDPLEHHANEVMLRVSHLKTIELDKYTA